MLSLAVKKEKNDFRIAKSASFVEIFAASKSII